MEFLDGKEVIELEKILIPHLVREEGFVSHAYEDSMGYLTIGVGRMIDKAKGGGITHSEAEFLLQNDVDRVTNALWKRIPWIKSLDTVRQAVLASMAFQLGVDGFLDFKHTLKMVQAERWGQAADGMLASLWADQTSERAERLAKAMETGEAKWLT